MVDLMEELRHLRKGVLNLFLTLESESDNLSRLLLSLSNVHPVLCVVYLPPNNNCYSHEDGWKLIENEAQMYKRMYPSRNSVFLGDFNAYTGDEDELQVGEPLVNEPRHNACLESECEHVFPTRKSRDSPRKINRWGRNLIIFFYWHSIFNFSGPAELDQAVLEITDRIYESIKPFSQDRKHLARKDEGF